MEKTLGKRIMEHRKRLGLTQDALAEKLGITAQAISKWENDLSCPDIATLPRLAEIFGITTDELLGLEPKTKVHEAEVVDAEDDDFDKGVFNLCFNSKEDDGKWTFHWDSGRKHAVLFAVCVLLVGVAFLLAKWYSWDVSFWDILWPSALLIYGFGGLFPKFSVFSFGSMLFGGYSLVHNLGLWQIDIAQELIFPICVVLFGIGLLIDALRKPKKPRFSMTKRGSSNKTTWNCRNTTNGFECDLAFGTNQHRVDVPILAQGEATVTFGELTIDLTACNCVAENCRLEATCAFGELVLLVPKRFEVRCENATVFAAVNISGQPDPCPEGVIQLDATVNFGEIAIRYI